MASGVFVEQKLPGAKYTLAFCSRWSTKGNTKTKKRSDMETVRTKKKKAGRRTKSVKREIRAAVRFTKTEYFIVKEKAATAGNTVSNYIRRVAINEQIRTRLTDEERKISKQLGGISHNINQVAKACHQEGVLKAMAYFQNIGNQLDEFLKKLKP